MIDFLKRNRIKLSIVGVLLMGYYFSLPRIIFRSPYSSVVESREGELLAAKIAIDGQWRFPMQDSVPFKFRQAIVYFEDEYFQYHFGFNPIAMGKAFVQNVNAKKKVRGASTLTQQVIRLSRKNTKRTYFEKMIELVLATRLEFRHSKKDILRLYAAHAPFGGNIVGVEMASWRYFGLPPSQLSWAEAATLAVLPNAPALIYPGKNQDRLIAKRNKLLLKLYHKKVIDKITYSSAILEPAPRHVYELPKAAPHLLLQLTKSTTQQRLKTTIQASLQNRVNQMAAQYHQQLKQSEIHNLAILVVDVKTRNILAYVGNSPTDKNHQKDVDIIMSARSTGSILKPLLYAAMLQDGMILPTTLIPDIPTYINGYAPTNFNETFEGAVPAERALARSLNVPAVLMLQRFGVARFHHLLQTANLRNITRSADHYGLSLILGGAEANLWDLCQVYANMSCTLGSFTHQQANYRKREWQNLNLTLHKKIDFGSLTKQKPLFDAASIWHTFNAMKKVNRPEGDEAWEFYDSAIKLAWKTGTSFGNRDAWAIGTNPNYVVGVWVGNASGEGRPSLTGVSSAAPILFDVFRLLPNAEWFETPFAELEEVSVCSKSGHFAQENCTAEFQLINKNVAKLSPCPYHKLIFLDSTQSYRVNSNCSSLNTIIPIKWFVLPPVMEMYYKSNHIDYSQLPPFRADCSEEQIATFEFIYPKNDGTFKLAKDMDGYLQPIIVKVAYSHQQKPLYWYLDERFLGETINYHEMPVLSKKGKYKLTVVDEFGNELVRWLEIV